MCGATSFLKKIPSSEVLDPGFDCIMEIWWNNPDDFEVSQRLIGSADRLPAIKQGKKTIFEAQ